MKSDIRTQLNGVLRVRLSHRASAHILLTSRNSRILQIVLHFPVPGPTNNIQVDTVKNAPQVTASWSYEGACDVVDFSVNVYDENGSSLTSLQTATRSVEIPELPQCVTLTVGVQGRNAIGLGPETKGSEFSILAAPGLIQNIQVDTLENAPQVTAKWSYEGACDVIDFNVNVYDVNGNSLKSMQTTTNIIEISEMSQCVDLIVGVQGRNAHGFGPESKGSRFFILAALINVLCKTLAQFLAPGLIQNIQVDTLENAPQVTAKWSYEGACDVIDFNVNVYDVNGNSLKSMQTTTNIIEISEMSQCVDLIVGVQGRNAYGFGPESKGSRFFILAAPGAPDWIDVTLESGVTVLWGQNSSCLVDRFGITVYNSTAAIYTITVDGNEFEVRLSKLPKNMSLLIGVRGHNSFGQGPEMNSTVFIIPKDPTAPIHLPVSLPKIISQESAVVTTLVPKTATSKQRGMNEDRSLAQNQAPEFLSDMPEEISSCDSVATGDCIQSEYQSDQQVVSQVDHTISGRADPEKISNYDRSLYYYMK
ncbi:hypothetical protein T265_01711 [Opisthorchis viverrini]|uniref:Fibronectin type-III domain-containing protein n=1 Tax=Opisthorchis viverrini TaxID=6198 RepID=A0A075A991_OPIVI|nr:hypothetical protein T265_01711 [Opisthorchis viverrini]KER32295.1 hypothetical protein T265_01711 [Opisthorchis viverrini]